MSEIILVFFGALSRLIPHPANFTAIVAVALFGAMKMQDTKKAFLIPLAAMLLSDTVLEVLFRTGLAPFQGFHAGMIYVYGAFMLVTLIGLGARKNFSIQKLAGATLLSSVVFFIVTNFGVWLSGYYGLTAQGLAECYIAAIPFFRNQVLGDAFFTAALFGADYLIRTKGLAKAA
jgi:hypothetical protein